MAPEGFSDLLALVKKSPVKKATGGEVWTAFVRAIMLGKDRYDAEISFLMQLLKDKLAYDYVIKTNGEDWRDDVKAFLEERATRIQDEGSQAIIEQFIKDLFYFSASLKGGARFFKAKNIPDDLDKLTVSKETTQALITEMVESKDLTGVKFGKAILWLHLTGRGQDFMPPTVQLKGFINNDVGPYYQFYEDDDYFMKKASEFASGFKASALDVYRAIYIYRMFKMYAGRGGKMTPKKAAALLKKRKLTAARVYEMLADLDQRDKLVDLVKGG